VDGRKRTKIVATLGPSTSSDEMVSKLIDAGVDVFRLNFSHGSHETHRENIERVRRIAREMGRPIALLQDIPGPKIRVGEINGGQATLVPGQTFMLTTTPLEGNEKMASVTYPRLTEDVREGMKILLDDGLLELVVVEVKPEMLVTRVVVGGALKPRKGVNFPGSMLKISIITDKDKADLKFGAEMGVARGDLGVEIPVEDVPIVQKQVIRNCNLEGKPVITATQMLDSMIRAPRPTRAEASDVANAILDGTDAVMLSNETAAGAYPLESVETMARIAMQVERSMMPKVRPELEEAYLRPVQDSVAHAATRMVRELGASAIVTATYSGSSARMNLIWGVFPIQITETQTVDDLFQQAVAEATNAGLVEDGDQVILVAGIPMGLPGTTNMVTVEVVSSIIARGMGLGQRPICGIARVVFDPTLASESVLEGDVLVTENTDAEWNPAIEKAGAIVVRSGGLTSHAAIVGLELNKPVILGVEELDKIRDGATITVDPLRGLIFSGEAKIGCEPGPNPWDR
jgi:pyruvate kinase